jgi:hypothetical protein
MLCILAFVGYVEVKGAELDRKAAQPKSSRPSRLAQGAEREADPTAERPDPMVDPMVTRFVEEVKRTQATAKRAAEKREAAKREAERKQRSAPG